MKKKWSKKEINELKELISQKYFAKKIATILDRTVSSIRRKCYELEIKISSRKWQIEELNLLKKCASEYKTLMETTKIITTRSREVISAKARSLELSLRGKSANKKWTDDEIIKLKQLRNEGKTYIKISNILEKPNYLIQSKCKELNIKSNVHKNKIFKISENVIFNKYSKKELLKQLKEFKKKVNNKNLFYILCRRFSTCKERAKKMNIDFLITKDDLFEIYNKQNGLCFYSGIKMEFITNGRNFSPYILSVDRIDSNLGYVKDNIVLSCAEINFMKRNQKINDFIELCNKITQWNNKKITSTSNELLDNKTVMGDL